MVFISIKLRRNRLSGKIPLKKIGINKYLNENIPKMNKAAAWSLNICTVEEIRIHSCYNDDAF